MSFKQVQQLRKNSELDEALKIASADLETNPNDEWNKRSIMWVYYEFMKIAVKKKKSKDFLFQLKNIAKLNLPPKENIAYDSVAWTLGKYLFKNKPSEIFLDESYKTIQNFHFSKPADSYSFLLKAFRKHAYKWEVFYDFVQWWGVNNFQKNDYENFVTEEGKKLPSNVELVYIALSKHLLKNPNDNMQTIIEFLPEIEYVAKTYKKMQYPPYYYAKLLLLVGDKGKFLDAFLPFARKKQRDFWVWNLLSEVYDKNSNEYFSCLCKSLSCGAPDKFTINVREKIANIFVKQELYSEAKYEYQKIIETRDNEGWPLREKHMKWQELPWWEDTQVSRNNIDIYNKNLHLAKSLLFANTEEEIIAVEFVNEDKKVFSFIASKQKYGFTHYGNFDLKPIVGKTYKVR
ncbi:MAG: hypothetical protein U9R32_07365, partial [Bacteroidota bacterium]|nr:hypothetical protein [Bacteroidota bacterium]